MAKLFGEIGKLNKEELIDSIQDCIFNLKGMVIRGEEELSKEDKLGIEAFIEDLGNIKEGKFTEEDEDFYLR